MRNNKVSELKEKYSRLRTWQHQPHQVAPLSEEMHDCPTCGTHFQGNYCPRCGQSARIGRYSFKKAFLLFLDVWGLGNRGMFRTLRDLILRPGYMIRDYLSGMQMAYFPPFKMFFLLIALSLLVETGLNIKGENRIEQGQEQFEKGMNQARAEQEQEKMQEKKTEEKTVKPLTAEEKAREERIEKLSNKVSNSTEISNRIIKWIYQHLTFVMLIGLLLVSGPLYLIFRHSPAIPDLRYSEFFVAMIYTTNMLNIYSIVCSLLCFHQLVEILLYPLAIIPIKQLSGYGYWSTIWRVLMALTLFGICFMLLIFGISVVGSIIYINMG
jgi:hypothetical protein